MRLQTLDLIRYGRFSGQTLQFPQADCDFHLIVGANEAGKSTLRRAVADLLFGMPLRSDMGFIHPLAELRLGAVIASAAGTLAFHRARGRKSLRRPDDAPLPDDALAEHLGGSSEALFKRMFCLDLAGLLEGGQSILDASDDMGQLLFQSAAGLAGLGAVRDALAAEAGKLYAPRRSGERAFYQALDRLDAAKQELRGLTMNTRQWTAAIAHVETLKATQDEAAQQYRALSATRQQLERIRRVAPGVAQLRDVQAQLQAFTDTVEFPDGAGQRLDEDEVLIASQSTALSLHREAIAALQAQLAALPPDDRILLHAVAVEALVAQSHTCAQHRLKIARAAHELEGLLREVFTGAAQLHWPADEASLRVRLPSSLALDTLSTLMEERGALLQAEQSAQDTMDRSQGALGRLKQQQAAPPAPAPSPALAGALQDAQPFKNSGARQRTLQSAHDQVAAQLEATLAALSTWRMDIPALTALALPTDEHLTRLKAERAALAATLEAQRQQHAQAQDLARQSALALAQFTAAHSVVTLDDVMAARAARDGVWQRIKDEQEPLRAGAPHLDDAIGAADRLVDNQRDHAEDSARLQGLRQDQERDAATALARAQQLAAAQDALERFDLRWTEQASVIGLRGMPLHDLSDWLSQRKAALNASSTLQAKALELEEERAAESAAKADLWAALLAGSSGGGSGGGYGNATTTGIEVAVAVEDKRLSELCTRAEQWLSAHQAAGTEAALLTRQLAEAQSTLDLDVRTLQKRSAAVAQWQARWNAAVAASALDGDWMTPDVARGAIALAQKMLALLATVDDVRLKSIQAMQQDLADFDAAAQGLRSALGIPGDADVVREAGGAGGVGGVGKAGGVGEADGVADSFAWSQALVPRLQQARDTHKSRGRLASDLKTSEDNCRAAELSLATTRAALQPLYALARSEEPAVVRACIAESERRRAISAATQQHRQAILDHGDGLSLDALLAECDADPAPETIRFRLDELEAQQSALVQQQNRVAGELAQAQAELAKMQGGTDAAVAESKRLEALAQLGDAAERYVTVATGQRLLRWAIDRYRERKQGPLLQRASALFSQLTLGGFSRLVPDFETTPPKLIALRGSGERVGIEGLSEGTRDQLFLALRLAALEMQIANDRPLPFIADDLFVNFHDSRSRAGLAALGELARKTQVIFLTHHEHLVEVARECVGSDINVVELGVD
jgi:uncharacterized protein YhaN